MSEYKPAKLSYSVCEPATGGDDGVAPLIFLHGLTASCLHWGGIPQRIADETKRKAFVLDARNHGDSPWTDEFSFEIVAKDLVHFLDVQDIPKAVLVGHSMGGIASMLAALDKPERVEKLVIEDIMLKKLPEEAVSLLVNFMQLLQESLKVISDTEGATEEQARESILHFVQAHIAKMASSLKLPEGQPPRPNMDGPYLNLKKCTDGRFTFKTNFKVLQQYASRLALEDEWKKPEGTYKGRALFIYGSLSQVNVGEDKENVKQNFTAAEFFEIEGASHSVHQDKPDEFTNEVLKFLL